MLRGRGYEKGMRALAIIAAIVLSACAGSPRAVEAPDLGAVYTDTGLALPDRAAFYQTDKRWAGNRLGNSSDSLASDGCLVTAVAMAMRNLGIDTDPGELNRDLRRANAFTPNGWLVWSGIEVASGGRAKATYHDSVSPELIRQCMADGQYPLVRFYLPNGRSHWAMIVREGRKGYRMRDPLRRSDKPLIFPRGAEAFRSLRCVGAA